MSARESVNFRSFWWLVRLEAVSRIRYPQVWATGWIPERRRLLWEPPSILVARTERILRLNEARGHWE